MPEGCSRQKKQHRKMEGNTRLLGRQCQGKRTLWCGVIIKGADRDAWVTISKIAVPLRTCSAMTAEVVGACILTETPDMILNKVISVDNVHRCIDEIIQ